MWRTIAYSVVTVSAVLLIISILLQNRGSGLGATFGGDSNVYRTKRGIEKLLLILTIVFAVCFFGASIVVLLLPQ